MSVTLRGESDGVLDQVVQSLNGYESRHPAARIEAYRQNPASLRIRIVDPDFAGVGRADRHEAVWRVLETLPDEVQSQVSLLILLTPEETNQSVASFDFDHPIPSGL